MSAEKMPATGATVAALQAKVDRLNAAIDRARMAQAEAEDAETAMEARALAAENAHATAIVQMAGWVERAETAEAEAAAILTSTDPAVHAAMLDALTRHGVLTEERMVDTPGIPDYRRLVTPWEVAP